MSQYGAPDFFWYFGIMCLVNIYKIIIIIATIAVLGFVTYIAVNSNDEKNAVGKSSSASITTKSEWEEGTLVNIDSISSEGTIQIDNQTITRNYLDVTGYDYSITATVEANKENPVVGGNWDATWYCTDTWEVYNGAKEWTIDFGEEVGNFYTQVSYSAPAASAWPLVYYSSNGVDWTHMNGTNECLDPAFNFYDPSGEDCAFHEGGAKVTTNNMGNARYVRISNTNGYAEWWDEPGLCADVPYTLWDFKIFTESAVGTHTTASTQIDGHENSTEKDLVEWISFSPSESEPENTTIYYSFRTSDDGSSWTSWSAPQAYSGSPLDLTTLTPNRYLQVRATLSTTDALATPQIDDYTINFHNNQKPNKPTAQTAVIGN